MFKVFSKVIIIVVLLLLSWDRLSESFEMPTNIFYALIAVIFALIGLMEIKNEDKDKWVAYPALFASGILFLLVAGNSIGML